MTIKQNWIIGIIIIATVVFFIFAIALFLSSVGTKNRSEFTPGGSKIALVEVTGVIIQAEDIVRQLDKYNRDKSVKGIVLRIESPGGGIAASQEIYEKVKQVRDSGKVVIASMGSVAASGGYYIALGADTIMANQGTTTGSIGVIAEIPNTSELLNKIGIKYDVIKSGKFKDTGSPFRKMTEEDRTYLQGWIDDAFTQFFEVVVNERKLIRSKVMKYADGRVFTGKQALAYGLIDTLGTYDDAINLAARLGGIEGKPKTIKERKTKVTIFDLLFQDLGQIFDSLQSWPRIKYQLVF